MQTKTIVSWDLGATKCTAGIVEYHPVTHGLICKKHATIKLATVQSFEDLIHALEARLDFRMRDANAICIGAAGHYDGKQLYHTNAYPYPMQFANVAKLFKWPAFTVIHDYASIVCATFTSYMEQPRNLKRLNACSVEPHGRRVALGLGTGLGLKDGVLLENGDFWLGHNEIGHIGVIAAPRMTANELKRHRDLMKFLRAKQKTETPVNFEHILTGKGTVNLFEFFDPNRRQLTPEAVGDAMRAGQCEDMLDAFAWYIGLFVGSVQLTFMPEGGVWITGGVALNHLDVFDRPSFQAGIAASPAYLPQRENYALGVLCNHEHALIGNGYYAAKRLLAS